MSRPHESSGLSILRRFVKRLLPPFAYSRLKALQWSRSHRSPAYVQLAQIAYGGLLPLHHLTRLDRNDDARGRTGLRERVALAAIMEQTTQGARFDRAVIDYCSGNEYRASRSMRYALALGLCDSPSTRDLGEVALGTVALVSGEPELAWSHFQRARREIALSAAPVQYIEAAARTTGADLDAPVKDLHQAHDIESQQWLDILGVLFGTKRWGDIASLASVARAASDWTDDCERELMRLLSWVERAMASPASAPSRQGVINIGVVDYCNPYPREESTNLGDPVQTVAALSHLVRHESLEYVGDPLLVEEVQRLAHHVRQRFRVPRSAATVNLVPIDRDASHLNAVPADTWLIAFGWHMQAQALKQYDFPYHPHIKPIFISFHCNRRSMLTAEAVEYLREHGPVGCRDWYTVDLLTHHGVPAFFSGCLTTTLDTYFDPATARKGGPTAWVDTTPRGPGELIEQSDPAMRWDPLATRLSNAFQLVARYHDEFSTVVTKRLHAYLPARTVGAKTHFVPTSPGDIRFEGLSTAKDADLQAIRDSIRELLRPVMSAILDGADSETVSMLWQESTSPLVEQAIQARQRAAHDESSSALVAQAVASVRARMRTVEATQPRQGAPINICFGLDTNFTHPLHVVTAAVLNHTSRPVHLWLLSRGFTAHDQQEFSRLFPEVTTTWLPCDGVDHGKVLRMIPHITVATMDRLLLPEVLTELDKVLYLDLDLLPLGDVSELHDTELGDAPLAARSSILEGFSSGFDVMSGVARTVARRGTRSWELMRRVYQEHEADFPAFNAGVLVMNLAVMRTDNFCERFLPFVERYGMHDQDVLNFYAGERRAQLEPRWNHIPHQEILDAPRIVHWSGPAKPWGERLVRFQEEWREAESTLASRTSPRP